MVIIGLDYHPSDQYIAFADTETGECGKRQLHHSDGEAAKFYRELAARGVRLRVGMEATGYSRSSERISSGQRQPELIAKKDCNFLIADAASTEC